MFPSFHLSRRPAVLATIGMALALLTALPANAQDSQFIRGDSNIDGMRDISDPIFTLRHLFHGGLTPACQDAADTNDDGIIDLSDATMLLWFLFQGTVEPPAPGGFCGPDPTPDELTCLSHPPCVGRDFTDLLIEIISAGTLDDALPVEIQDLNLGFSEDPAAFDVLFQN